MKMTLNTQNIQKLYDEMNPNPQTDFEVGEQHGIQMLLSLSDEYTKTVELSNTVINVEKFQERKTELENKTQNTLTDFEAGEISALEFVELHYLGADNTLDTAKLKNEINNLVNSMELFKHTSDYKKR